MIYVGYLILVIAFVVIFVALIPKEPETVSVFGKKVKEKKGSPFSPILSPLAPFNKFLLKSLKVKDFLDNKITLARWQINSAEFLSAKEILAFFVPLLAFLLFNLTSIWWLIGIAFFGFVLPDIILMNKVRKRKYSIVRILPETVDLLSLCVGAGLDFMAAVRWITEKVKPNPLIEELQIVLREISVGRTRLEALRDMAKRLDIPDITSFVRTLVQADRMGTPVEEAFKILSEDTRMRRFHRGERLAMKAPIKMLVPLIFCILPVIFIVVAGPILIKFITQGLFSIG